MDKLLYEKVGPINILTLNRPNKKNAMDYSMISTMLEYFKEFKNNDDSRVLIITGAGDQAFSSGIDLKAALQPDMQASISSTSGRIALFEAMIETWKPIICAINGLAVGGGCEMALAADIRIASEGIKIGLTEAKRGMGSSFGSVILPRLISPNLSLQMLLTGRLISAEEAYRIGMVNEVVPHKELMSCAMDIANEIVACAPLSVRRIKENVWKTMGVPLFSALRMDIGPNVYESEDRIEGAKSFMEGRDPIWKGR